MTGSEDELEARRVRRHFHLALLAILMPVVSLPGVIFFAAVNAAYANGAAARRWVRAFVGLAALDALVALVVVALAAGWIEMPVPGAALETDAGTETGAATETDAATEGGIFEPVEEAPTGASRARFWLSFTPALLVALGLVLATRRRVDARRFWGWMALILAGAFALPQVAALVVHALAGGPTVGAFLVALCAQPVALLLLSVAARRRLGPGLAFDERPSRSTLGAFGLGALYTLAFLPRVGLVAIGLDALAGGGAGPSDPVGQLLGRVVDVPAALATMLIVIVVAGPIAEEYAMRGVLLPWLRRGLGPVAAVAGSAALFGLLHPHYGAFVLVPCLHGLTLGWARLASGGLLAPILLHVSINAVASIGLLAQALERGG